MGTGHENSAGFAILYRALNHGEMRRTFAALAKATLSDKYRNLLHRSTLCQDMRAFAKAFPNLQTLRHLADYDPAFSFSVSGAAAVIDEAELALEAFERVPEDEKTDVLALLLAGSRG
jgi:hypothetical protein